MTFGHQTATIAEVALRLRVTKDIDARFFVQDGFRIEFYLDGSRIWDENLDRNVQHEMRAEGFVFRFDYKLDGVDALRCEIFDEFYPANRATLYVLRDGEGSLDVALDDRGHRFVRML